MAARTLLCDVPVALSRRTALTIIAPLLFSDTVHPQALPTLCVYEAMTSLYWSE